MASLTTYDALKTWFDAHWTQTARRYENDGYEPPSDLSPFVYLEVTGDLFRQISIGGAGIDKNLWRESGVAVFSCCVKSGSSVSVARGYAVAIADALRGLTLAPGIRLGVLTIGAGSPFVWDGNYYAVPLTAEWLRDF